jgi:indolepyruvate ferredoxin oxidoreductase beta subunit
MKQARQQQLIISGRGGQGVLTITRLLAETAAALALEVITAETHGMAQRGGSVISMVKVGPFMGPLIAPGQAQVGLFLAADNLPRHSFYLHPQAAVFVNTKTPGSYQALDALGLAQRLGLPPVSLNLILLGYAAASGQLFCPVQSLEETLAAVTPAKWLAASHQALTAGAAAWPA